MEEEGQVGEKKSGGKNNIKRGEKNPKMIEMMEGKEKNEGRKKGKRRNKRICRKTKRNRKRKEERTDG